MYVIARLSGLPASSDHLSWRQIVRNMGMMTNPWCCPHGRPTLRHLLDLRRARSAASAQAGQPDAGALGAGRAGPSPVPQSNMPADARWT